MSFTLKPSFLDAAAPEEAPAVSVPPGVSYLRTPGLSLSSERPASMAGTFVLEPFGFRNESLLLLRSPRHGRPRINGRVAPAVAVLRARDELALGTDALLEVALGGASYIGKPRGKQLGASCPVCLETFTENTTVYVCECGVAFHVEGEEVPPDKRLECLLLLRSCPECHRALPRKGSAR
ncbi:MAG: hypothetical protein ACE5F1_02325 [Planctomycetota bacterium]